MCQKRGCHLRNSAFARAASPRDYVADWPANWPAMSTEYRQGFQVGMCWMDAVPAARCEVPEPPYSAPSAARDAWMYGFNDAMKHAEGLRHAA